MSNRKSNYRSDRRKRIRQSNREYIASLKLKGCQLCGYNKCSEALDFHHVGDKIMDISDIKYHSPDRLKREIDKCILVCANCHREIHAGQISPPSEERHYPLFDGRKD